jgi:hypothetical protein
MNDQRTEPSSRFILNAHTSFYTLPKIPPLILPNMQANLFKLLAIAAAFSAVSSAPVETAEVTTAQVNGTQVNGTQTNDSYKVAGVC